MASSFDASDSPDKSVPETSTRKLRRLNQLEFELEFLGRILQRDPLYADVLKVHAKNLATRGLYSQALQIDRQLTKLRPDRPIPWYNLACSYALMGMVDAAFDALERSLRLGYDHIRHLQRDPDLKTLRSDPRFARYLRLYAGLE